MQLSKNLLKEINSYDSTEPNVKLFIDESGIFWNTKDNEFVWLQNHSGLSQYINNTHNTVDEKTPEGLNNYGVYWMNQELESPLHISDFLERIKQINAIR